MRSRFTAFALQDEAHLLRSWHPSTRPATVQLVSGQRWTGLEVLATIGGEMLDKEGDVEFRATYARRGRPGTLHELNRFVRHEVLWAYLGAVEADLRRPRPTPSAALAAGGRQVRNPGTVVGRVAVARRNASRHNKR